MVAVGECGLGESLKERNFSKVIACSGAQMETGDKFLKFHLIRNWSSSQERYHIKISQVFNFEVLLLDCNQVEGFQKLEKIGDFVWIWGMPSQN